MIFDAAGNPVAGTIESLAQAPWGEFAPADLQAMSEMVVDPPTYTDVRDADLYGMLQQGLRDVDRLHGGQFLQRFLLRAEDLWARHQQKIHRLALLDDPDRCPAALLDYLLALVGFGPKSRYKDVVAALDEVGKRKLAKVAVPLWKEKGRRDSILDVVRLVTGFRPVVFEWNEITGQLDVGFFGAFHGAGDEGFFLTAPLLVGGLEPLDVDDPDAGEHHLYVRVVGASLPGSQKDLLETLLGILRPVNEYWEVAYVDFLDTFLDGILSWWDVTGTVTWKPWENLTVASYFPDGSGQQFVVPNGAELSAGAGMTAIPPLNPGPLGNIILSFHTSFHWGIDNQVSVFVAHSNAFFVRWYEFRLTIAGVLEVYSKLGAAPALLGTMPVTRAKNRYHWSILHETYEQPAGTQRTHLRVEFDGPDDVLDLTIAAPVHLSGDVRIEHSAGADPFRVHRVECFGLPLDARLVRAEV